MATLTACALPGCSNPMIPGRTPYSIGSNPGKYCSRGCVTIAFELMRKGKKFFKAQTEKVDYVREDERQEAEERVDAAREDSVKVVAKEFGGAEVYRRYCDNPACEGPITVSWKGRRGEYCSNNCLKTEKENNMTDETMNEETASPIAAGAPATKKTKKGSAGKKAASAKKTAPAKKNASAVKKAAPAKAPKAATGGERASFPKDGVITVVKPITHTRKGKAGDAFDALKSGITVEKYREAVYKKNPKNGAWYVGDTLKFALAEGLIKIK